MKNFLLRLIVSIACVTAILTLMSAGCDNREGNVGYHYVSIPQFEEADYIALLNNSNAEMQYNALCYFAEHDGYDAYLTTDSLKRTGRYDTALMLYQKIYPLMNSSNSWVSSAAVLFISKFKYNRPAFVKYALNNTNPSVNVQLEIISDLLYDSAKDRNLLQQKVSFLQKHPSWLLQNGCYQLMSEYDSITPEPLIQQYKASGDEYKKLLLLEVLCSHLTDDVFVFVTKEWASTKNDRIKEFISSSIIRGSNHQQVVNWYAAHWPVVEEQMEGIIEMASEKKSADVCSKVIAMALSKGWKPSAVLQNEGENKNEYDGEPRLFISLLLNKYRVPYPDSISKEYSIPFKRIENTLLQTPDLKTEWLAFEKRSFKYPLPATLIQRQKEITKAYLQQTSLLLQQYKVDTTVSNHFVNEINYQVNSLTGSRARKKE